MRKEDFFTIKISSNTGGIRDKIRKNWDMVAKPLDGLGLLEDMICTVGAAQGSEKPQLSPRALVIM